MSYLGSVAASVTTIDRVRLRRWSAIRRGLLVGVTFVVTAWLTNPEVGALAAVAGLYVGLQDRNEPARFTAETMAAQSMLFFVVVLIGGFFNPFVGGAVMILCAAVSGLAAQHDKSISRMFADVLNVLAFLALSRMTHELVLQSAVAVLAAGLLQAAATIAAGRWTSDLPERRPVAAALTAVAEHLEDAQVRQKSTTGPAAEAAIVEADATISRSDLTHRRRRALRKILGDAEQLRLEASAIRVRRAFDVGVIEEPEVDEALAIAASSLRAAAVALLVEATPTTSGRGQRKALAELSAESGRAHQIAEDRTARPTARSVASQAVRIDRHVAHLQSADSERMSSSKVPLSDRDWDDLFHPGPSDIRSGLRLAVAAIIGLALAAVLDLPHGAWVAATSVALLRPDHRALTSDTISRAVGVALGAAAVVPIVFITGNSDGVNVILVTVLAIGACAVTSANEGLFIVAVTVFTVFTRAAVGENPVQVAETRLLDVLAGCVIAVLLLFLLPLRQGRLLGRQLSEYAEATADWLAAVAQHAAGKKPKGMKKRRRAVRRARVEVQHGLDIRRIEPLGPGVSAWRGQIIFSRIHDAGRAATAAQVSLAHGAKPDSCASEAAEHAAAVMRCTARELRHRREEVGPDPIDLPETPGDAVSELLVRADAEAIAAFAAVSDPQSVGSSGPG